MIKTPNIERGNHKAMTRVARDQQFFGMLLFAAFINEPKEFAMQCFERCYPDELSKQRLYELSLDFYATYYGEK